MLDYYGLIATTNSVLDEQIALQGQHRVFFTETNEYAEWRRDAFAVRLFRGQTPATANYSFYKNGSRCGRSNFLVSDEEGAAELAAAVLDHAGGRERVY